MGKRFTDRIKIKKGELSIGLTLIGYKDKNENLFVLYAPALDLYAYGDSEDEAFIAFDETINLYMDHLLEEKTLEKDLTRLGWQKHTYFNKRFAPPIYDPREIMSNLGVNSFNVIDKQLELQA